MKCPKCGACMRDPIITGATTVRYICWPCWHAKYGPHAKPPRQDEKKENEP